MVAGTVLGGDSLEEDGIDLEHAGKGDQLLSPAELAWATHGEFGVLDGVSRREGQLERRRLDVTRRQQRSAWRCWG